jgi:perosamine synthetase
MTISAPALERRTSVYHSAVKRNFATLKQSEQLAELMAKSLSLPASGGWLVPVSRLHASDTELITKLSEWRRENYFAYPSQFPVTDERTTAWMNDRLLAVADRVLFLVLDKHGKPVGHMGFANGLSADRTLEADNIVRGVKQGNPGIMSEGMRVLLDWAEEKLGPEQIFLRVFSDNTHAVEFYKRLGFVEDVLLPLRRSENGETISFSPVQEGDSAPADKHFLRMIYRPERAAGKTMILTAGPSISAAESWYALDATQTGWNSKWSGYLNKFESAFKEYVGVEHGMLTSSCTGALHIALLALGIGPGDEVIVPDITWVATANAVRYVGATPVFADVQEGSWCLDPVSFESLITEKTKCVMPVHLYGHPAEMDTIVAIARKHNLYIVEDAAPAIGAECNGRKTGTYGDFAAFSFQGAKLLVTGEGGILLTSNKDLYNKAYSIWDQGRRPGTFWIQDQGYKYKLANPLAAIGLGQLERVDELIEAKRKIFEWYDEGLAGFAPVQLNYEASWARSIYWMSSIVVSETASVSRDELIKQLKSRNVDTRPVFPAISQYPIWERRQEAQPTAARIGRQGINLPSGVCLKRDHIAYVCAQIREILGDS